MINYILLYSIKIVRRFDLNGSLMRVAAAAKCMTLIMYGSLDEKLMALSSGYYLSGIPITRDTCSILFQGRTLVTTRKNPTQVMESCNLERLLFIHDASSRTPCLWFKLIFSRASRTASISF